VVVCNAGRAEVVPKNDQLASVYLKAAATQGFQPATAALAEMKASIAY
jgi:hypothetical protein